jgi:hypothetical protein
MDYPDPTRMTQPLPPAGKWVRRAIWSRWVLLGLYAVLTAGWYYVFFAVSDPWASGVGPAPVLGPFVIATLVLFGVQGLLLAGAPQLKWPRPRRRRSMAVSLAAGSAIAVLLSLGIVCAGASLYKLIYDPGGFRIQWTAGSVQPAPAPTTAPAAAPPTTTAPAQVPAPAAPLAGTPAPAPVPASPPFSWRTDVPWAFVGIMLAGWAFWLLVFSLIGGGQQWGRRFGRMYRTLIAGTVLELLITIPIDAQVRRRTDCYCGEGTFYALAIGLTAVLWVFGPGIAILFLVRRQHRLGKSGRCFQCGYDLRGLDSARCPECGMPFKRDVPSHAAG